MELYSVLWSIQKDGTKWQTIDVKVCIVWEQKGFNSESSTIKAQGICLDS